ncbi:MAG: AAA family ATPase [bacterium]|nr:AAA family ATPase [bacterium]
MKITHLKLEGFGLFNEPVDIELSGEKINVIIGNNETGKTTLMRGLIATLFGLDKARWNTYKSVKPSEKYSGELEFTRKNTDYTIIRDFETNEVELLEKRSGQESRKLFKGKASPQSRTEEKEYYYDFLKKIIGLSSETVFNNVNVVRQRFVESEIDSEIQHILTGAIGTNYRTILEKWLEEYFSITRKSVWPDIRDKRNEKELEILTNDLNRLNETKEKLIEKSILSEQYENESRDKEKRISELQEKNRRLGLQHELSRNYMDHAREKKQLEEKLYQFGKEVEKFNRLKTEYGIKDNKIRTDFPDHAGLQDEDISDLKEYRRLIAESEKKQNELESLKKNENTSPVKRIFLGANGLVASGLLFLFRFQSGIKIFLYIGILLGLASLVYLVRAVTLYIRSRTWLDVLFQARSTELQALQTRISALKEKTESRRSVAAVPALDEKFFVRYEEYKKLKQEMENLKYSLDTFQEIKDYQAKKVETEKALISINTGLKQLESENPALVRLKDNMERSIQYIQNLKNEISTNEVRIREIDAESRSLHKRLALTFAEPESIASLKYRIEETEEKLKLLEKNRKAFILATGTLSSAIKEYQEKHVDRLSRNISQYYEKITGGFHSRILLTDDFKPLVQDKENRDEKNLSCGAEEQLHFSVRLALIKEINNLTNLPLFLDDPFVNFDKERLKVVKDILYTIKDQNQIILFTHFRSYMDWENIKVIKL